MKMPFHSPGASPIGRKKPNRRILRVVFRATLACFTALALSGCLLNRMVELKDQFCDFDSNFSLQFEDSMEFSFNQPMLLDTDILWLSGAPPTKTTKSADELTMTFVIEKVMSQPGYLPDPADDIQVDLHFDRFDDGFKLRRVRMDPKLTTLMNPDFFDKEVINSAAQEICDTGRSFASTKMEMDIPELELRMLPNRQEILELLGAPLEHIDQDTGFVYQYRLKGEKHQSEFARLVVWFDESGEKPVRMESNYSRYHTIADFIEKKLFLRVTL
jgi:hypothetical protein